LFWEENMIQTLLWWMEGDHLVALLAMLTFATLGTLRLARRGQLRLAAVLAGALTLAASLPSLALLQIVIEYGNRSWLPFAIFFCLTVTLLGLLTDRIAKQAHIAQ
jgi:hypothetical protein